MSNSTAVSRDGRRRLQGADARARGGPCACRRLRRGTLLQVNGFDYDKWAAEVEQMTRMMRHAEGAPLWRDLRRELQKRGVKPDQALLVESYEEAADEVGVIVSTGPRVLVYRVRNGDWRWADVSVDWQSSEFAHQVQVGLGILR
jgi:hypothetical protein